MSEDWQNDPATEMQKEKLRFFSCTWHEGITREQASKVLSQCVEKFPEKESEWQSRPATPGQLRQLKEHGIEAEPGMTYRKANGLILLRSVEFDQTLVAETLEQEQVNNAATDLQKEKLRFFGYKWKGKLTKWRATLAITNLVEKYPDKEQAWRRSPATPDQIRELQDHGMSVKPTMTYRSAQHLICSFSLATDLQQRKLRFFGCWWKGKISKAQAEAELEKRIKRFPEREKEWQNCPATSAQIKLLKMYGVKAKAGMTFCEALDLLSHFGPEPSCVRHGD